MLILRPYAKPSVPPRQQARPPLNTHESSAGIWDSLTKDSQSAKPDRDKDPPSQSLGLQVCQ